MAGAGVRVFQSGEILTASQVNGYLMDQVISRFADAATRDAAFGGPGQPVLTEGRFCYLDDINEVQYYDGSTWQSAPQFALEDGAVTTEKLADSAVTNAKLSTNAVTAGKIASEAVTSSKIAAGAVTESRIAAGAVTESRLAVGAVTETIVGSGSITEAKIGSGAVTESKIASDAVTNAKLATGAVSEQTLQSNSVTETKIASSAVTESKIANGAITNSKLATGSVTESIIGSSAVTESKIANGSITNAKVATGAAIDKTKISGTAVTLTDNGTITSTMLGSQVVTQAKIANRAVGSSELDGISLTSVLGTSFTLTLAEAHKLLTLNNSSPITLTIPNDSTANFALGTQVNLVQTGAGQVTITGGVGVTVRSEGSKTKLNGQYALATCIKIANNEWVLVGNLTT